MLILKKSRELPETHSCFFICRFNEIPKTSYVNLTNASLIYIDSDEARRTVRVVAQFDEHKETIFVAYSDKDAETVLDFILELLTDTNNKNYTEIITAYDLEKMTKVIHAKNSYGPEDDGTLILAR